MGEKQLSPMNFCGPSKKWVGMNDCGFGRGRPEKCEAVERRDLKGRREKNSSELT